MDQNEGADPRDSQDQYQVTAKDSYKLSRTFIFVIFVFLNTTSQSTTISKHVVCKQNVMVEDDGETLPGHTHYKQKRTTFTWDHASLTLSWMAEGNFSGASTIFNNIVVLLFTDQGSLRSSVHELTQMGSITLHSLN